MLHGEARDAANDEISETLLNLRNCGQQCRLEDDWNGDETDCNYAMASDHSISSLLRSRKKK